MTLEERMLNVIRTTPVKEPKGKYKAALDRLVKKGLARIRQGEYVPSIQLRG